MKREKIGAIVSVIMASAVAIFMMLKPHKPMYSVKRVFDTNDKY